MLVSPYDLLNKRFKDYNTKYDLTDYIDLPDSILNDFVPLTDSKEAAKLILKHIDNKSLIVFAVDIDNDGINSGAIGYNGLRKIFNVSKDNLKLVISSRKFPRGFNQNLMDKIENIKKKTGREIGLVITADMGSYDNENYKRFKLLNPNTNIIVTDHHEVPLDNYPTEVDYLINPQKDKKLNEHENEVFGPCLCGCAVLFMLIYEIAKLKYPQMTNDKFIGGEEYPVAWDIVEPLVPYVALATIVDMMSMRNIYNRFLIKKGIISLHSTYGEDRNFLNFQKVLKLKNLSYRECSSQIGPLVNTANRVTAEEMCLLSFIIDDDERSLQLMEYINNLNKIRKEEVDNLISELMRNQPSDLKNVYVNKINSKMFISGSVAGAFSTLYNVPAIIFLNSSKDILYGSARSNVDILPILKKLPKEIVVDAAGHNRACGVSIYTDRYHDFCQLINKELEGVVDTSSELEAEYELEPTLHLADVVHRAGPYGVDYPEPIFKYNFIVKELIPIRTFYKLVLTNIDTKEDIEAMYFFRNKSKLNLNFINMRDIIRRGMKVETYYYIKIDYYKKDSQVMLEIIDIIPKEM